MEYAAAGAAVATERELKAELLDEVVEIVRPALAAIGDQLPEGPNDKRRHFQIGAVLGKTLSIREDGVLVVMEYPESDDDESFAERVPLEIREYKGAFEAIEDGWTRVDLFVEKLADALESAVGRRKKIIGKIQDRAEILRAILTLLRLKDSR